MLIQINDRLAGHFANLSLRFFLFFFYISFTISRIGLSTFRFFRFLLAGRHRITLRVGKNDFVSLIKVQRYDDSLLLFSGSLIFSGQVLQVFYGNNEVFLQLSLDRDKYTCHSAKISPTELFYYCLNYQVQQQKSLFPNISVDIHTVQIKFNHFWCFNLVLKNY